MNQKKKMNSSYDALDQASQAEIKARQTKEVEFTNVYPQKKLNRNNLARQVS